MGGDHQGPGLLVLKELTNSEGIFTSTFKTDLGRRVHPWDVLGCAACEGVCHCVSCI